MRAGQARADVSMDGEVLPLQEIVAAGLIFLSKRENRYYSSFPRTENAVIILGTVLLQKEVPMEQ